MTEYSEDRSHILVIVGMHRSGTSLTASLFHSAGLYVGRRLVPANEANAKGYFEDLDFHGFHKEALKSQGVDADGWTLQERIDVEDQFVDRAKQLVERAQVSRTWGWKDPRTTLFLDFWAQQLPEANFLLVYRSPWEVVDSLYRRASDKILREQPELAVKMWLHYNRKILSFYNQAADRCFLVNVRTLVSDFTNCVAALNQKFDLDLMAPDTSGFDASLFTSLDPKGYRASSIAHYFPEAVDMYRELEARSWRSGDEVDFSWLKQLQSVPYRHWAFEDWASVSELRRQKQDLERRLQVSESAKEELQQTQEELKRSQLQWHKTEEALKQSMTQLHETEEVLEQSVAQLQQKTEEFNQTQAQLHETEEILEQSVAQLQQKTEELNQTQAQLHETQEELERSQAQLDYIQERTNYQQAIAENAKGNNQAQYKLLVWDGWSAYLQGDLVKMSGCLQQSLKYTALSRTETISNWLETFGDFASPQNGSQLDIQQLINSMEWQQLTRRVTAAKSLIATH